MKYIFFLIILTATLNSYCQQLNGTVVDQLTKQPVKGALVKSVHSRSVTDAEGKFNILSSGLNDTLTIFHQYYKTYVQPFTNINGNKMQIELELNSILINEVTIYSKRDYRKDSLNNRLAFQKEFNYSPPKIKDALMGSNSPKTANSFISVNPLLLYAALTKKKSKGYQLKKKMITDEQETFVGRSFNREIVTNITGLQGDFLEQFLIRYKPTYEFAQKTSEYDMIIYIKDCHKKFKVQVN